MSAKRSIQFILAFLIFTIDVKVRARVIEVPKDCLKSDKACAVKNTSKFTLQKMKWGDIRAGASSSFMLVNGNEIRLLSGQFLIDAHEPVRVSTLYGAFEVNNGQALFEANKSITNFVNLSCEFKYTPRGEVKSYELPVGFMTYFTQINTAGVAETGYPRLAELKPMIKKMGTMFSQNEMAKLKSSLNTFALAWEKDSTVVGPWYRQVVDRELANEKAEEDRLARERARQKAEKEKLKEYFRARNYIGVDPGETHD